MKNGHLEKIEIHGVPKVFVVRLNNCEGESEGDVA